MKIGIRGTYGVEDAVATFKEDVDRYKPLGFEGLELCVIGKDRTRKAYDRLTDADVRAIREIAAGAGMEVASLSADWLWGYGAAKPQLAQWDDVVDGIGRDVALAKELGAKTVLIHFGGATGSWSEARSVLERMAAAAHEVGNGEVRLGYEASIFRRSGLGGLLEVKRMIDEVDSPALGVYEHPHYPRAGVAAHEEIELFGPRLCGLHLGRLDQVEIDWPRFLGALRRYYEGYIIFECGYDVARQNKEILERALAAEPGIRRGA